MNIGGVVFTPPVPLTDWRPPAGGGVYAILCLNLGRWEPIYIGKTESFADRNIGPSHHAYTCWQNHARSMGSLLYVATHRDDDDFSRAVKEKLLINRLVPICNQTFK